MKIVKKVLTVFGAIAITVLIIDFAYKSTPLHKGEMLYLATVTKDYDGMVRCIQSGAEVDFRFDSTRSSLEAAIESGDAKAVAILKKYGASNKVLSGHYERMLNSEEFAKRVREEAAKL